MLAEHTLGRTGWAQARFQRIPLDAALQVGICGRLPWKPYTKLPMMLEGACLPSSAVGAHQLQLLMGIHWLLDGSREQAEFHAGHHGRPADIMTCTLL